MCTFVVHPSHTTKSYPNKSTSPIPESSNFPTSPSLCGRGTPAPPLLTAPSISSLPSSKLANLHQCTFRTIQTHFKRLHPSPPPARNNKLPLIALSIRSISNLLQGSSWFCAFSRFLMTSRISKWLCIRINGTRTIHASASPIHVP